jgi:hypothetical protein
MTLSQSSSSPAGRHLSEEERQGAADNSLGMQPAAAADAHLRVCADCAADVGRLRTLMTRIHDLSPAAPLEDDLWPAIQARIEDRKVVPLGPSSSTDIPPRRNRVGVRIMAGIAAAALIVVSLPRIHGAARVEPPADSSPPNLTPIVDSARLYEDEANTLLNELEMQRAMMPPQAAAAIDQDLRTIDQAIAELKDALARDPNNPALRRLLASSYRQKVELLKRANHAG